MNKWTLVGHNASIRTGLFLSLMNENGENWTRTVKPNNGKTIKLVLQLIQNGEIDRIPELFEVNKNGYEVFRSLHPDSLLTYENGSVLWGGRPTPFELTEVLTSRFLNEVGQLPLSYWRFLHNIMESDNHRIVTQLPAFVAHTGMMISEDGHLLGVKAIRHDYYDKYTGTILYEVGNTYSMPRWEVSDDPTVACAAGFHIGSLEYATRRYGSYGDVIAVFKVHVNDIVSVPYDYEGQKLRCCRMTFDHVLGVMGTDFECSVSIDADNTSDEYDDRFEDVTVTVDNPYDSVREEPREWSNDGMQLKFDYDYDEDEDEYGDDGIDWYLDDEEDDDSDEDWEW